MKNYFLTLALLALFSCQPQQQTNEKDEKPTNTANETYSFYLGTYTENESKGIYKLSVDQQGQLQQPTLVAETSNPSFLTKSKDGKYLIAVNEIDEPASKGGTVTSYKISKDSLIHIDTKASGGAHPCFVTTNEQNFILTANYTGGSVGLLQLNEEGKLTELSIEKHTGKGPTDRQEAPHAHAAYFIPNSNDIVSVDLGTDQLWFSKIVTESNNIKLLSVNKTNVKSGAGPRHLAFHPQQNWLYVINELNSTITLLDKNETGQYQPVTSISTLPATYSEDNFCADIHISADGKFLYASNRGHNSIAVFSIDPTSGNLSNLAHTPVHGKWPRNFALSPDGNFLLVANQYSNNITVFKRNQDTGLLTFTSELGMPSPVCILF